VIDGGPYTSQRAVDVGLVDALVYPDELAEHLAGEARATLRSAEAIVASRRWRAWTPGLRRRPRILVLPISGLIKGGKSANLPTGPSMVGEESVVAQIDAARKDPKVRGVVIYADSRGGAAPASELIWRAVLRCAKEKPTAAYVETVAASGGYFAVAGAGRIFSAPGALVGSIGVFSGRFDVRQLLERLGVHREAHLRGAHAGLLNSAHPLGPEERRVLEAEIRQVYEDFLARVAEGRRLPVEAIEPHAEGRVFLGANAPKELVDEVGDLRDAVGWVCAQAKVDPAAAETVVLRPRSTGLRSLPALVQSVASMGRIHLWLLAPPVGDEPGI
jgi:protease-4